MRHTPMPLDGQLRQRNRRKYTTTDYAEAWKEAVITRFACIMEVSSCRGAWNVAAS